MRYLVSSSSVDFNSSLFCQFQPINLSPSFVTRRAFSQTVTEEFATITEEVENAAAPPTASVDADPAVKMTKLQLRYTSVNYADIKITFAHMVEVLNRYNLKWSRIRLPKEEHRITMFRSPHVHKKAKDSYSKFTYKGLVEIHVPSHLALKLVRNVTYNSLSSVHLTVKMIE